MSGATPVSFTVIGECIPVCCLPHPRPPVPHVVTLTNSANINCGNYVIFPLGFLGYAISRCDGEERVSPYCVRQASSRMSQEALAAHTGNPAHVLCHWSSFPSPLDLPHLYLLKLKFSYKGELPSPRCDDRMSAFFSPLSYAPYIEPHGCQYLRLEFLPRHDIFHDVPKFALLVLNICYIFVGVYQ